MKGLVVILAAATLAADEPPPWAARLAFWSWGSLHRLDARMREIDHQLSGLAEMALVNSCIRVGLKTGYTTEEDVRWIELALKGSPTVDSIVLIPPLAKGAEAVVAGYGFPVRFKLEIFDADERSEIVLDRTAEDFPNPGCYPVVARFAPRQVSRVRFTATDPWTVDGPEVLALAEMLVLSGNRNVALDAAVTSSSTRNAPRAWTRANLIDMITPLGLPVEPLSRGTLGFHSAVSATADAEKWITLSLPQAMPLDEIRLVPVRLREVPLWFDYGFPVLYMVECATREDFSDAVLLAEVSDRNQPSPGMNLVCIPAGGIHARHIRLTVKQLWYRRSDYVFALAEMQVLSGGTNVAAQGSFSASDELAGPEAISWSLASLNDGLTEGGRLIELPEWFTQLESRQALESERGQLVTRRASLLERTQRQLVHGSMAGTAAISLLSAWLIWRQNRQRQRDAVQLQEKLARDLHDEIGSNLGSITLISSMASQPNATLQSLREDLAEIERVAAESADSMRDMVHLMRPNPSRDEQDWLGVLHTLSERLLRGLPSDLALPAAPLAQVPDIETRRELYLFCKEVLHNIARHARATRARFHLTPAGTGLIIEISDNGVGFDLEAPSHGHGLGNLRERAAGLGASLQLTSTLGAGTTIRLEVPVGRRWSAA